MLQSNTTKHLLANQRLHIGILVVVVTVVVLFVRLLVALSVLRSIDHQEETWRHKFALMI